MSTVRSTTNNEIEDEWDQQRGGVEDFIQIRATAQTPANETHWLQTAALLFRFTGANLVGNNRNPEISKPWSGALDWGLLNIMREGGIALSYLFSSDFHDILDSLRATGHGNAAKGLAINIVKMLLANAPSTVVGIGVDGVALYFQDAIAKNPGLQIVTSRPVSRIIAALISPWIYIAFKKFVIDRAIPTPSHAYNQTPPLHPLQEMGMVGFNIYDMTTTYEFIHTLLKITPTKKWGYDAILHHPHFPLGIVPMYALYQHGIDPIAFGRRLIPDAPPFEIHAPTLTAPNRRVELLLDDAEPEPATSLTNYEAYRGEVAHGARGYNRCDSIKTAGWIAACTTIAAAASVGADYIACRIQEDKELLTDPLRLLYTSLIAASYVGTFFIVSKGAPLVATKVASSSCWARLFSHANYSEDTPAVEVQSLLAAVEDLESGLSQPPDRSPTL